MQSYPIIMGVYNVNNYFIHSLVTLQSLCTHSQRPIFANILCDATLNDCQKECFSVLLKHHGGDVKFIDLTQYLSDIPDTKSLKRFSIGTMFRLFIPEFFKEGHLLYVDSDVCATCDPAIYYDSEKQGHFLLSAVQDIGFSLKLVRPYIMNIGCTPEMYFNAGITFFNCAEINANFPDFTNIALRLLKNVKMLNFPDQDILNLLFKDRTQLLSTRANFQIYYKKRAMLPPEKLKNRIIHYSGQKPWDYIYPAGLVYWQNRKALLNYPDLVPLLKEGVTAEIIQEN